MHLKHWSKYRGRFFEQSVATPDLDIILTSTFKYPRNIVKKIYIKRKEKDFITITYEFKINFRGFKGGEAF